MNGLCDDIKNEVYFVRIYVYRLTRLDGTGVQALSAVNETLNIMTQAFADIGILFSVQEFEELKVDDDAYEFTGASEINKLLAYKSHGDGIDIFFCGPGIYDQAISFVGGVEISETANVIGGGTAPFCDEPDVVPSAVLAHEMGHSLGLIHPDNQFGFNDPPSGTSNFCAENPYDCRCHDHVFDTEGFDSISQEDCMYDNCDCNPTSCGPFQNVVKNIMTTSTPLHCKTEFTQGQAYRMKRYLSECETLQNIVSNITIPTGLNIIWDTSPNNCLPSVEIADGASLTIKNGVDNMGNTTQTTIEFAPGSSITVMDGGRLKIQDGAILKGCGNSDWKGMVVNGNPGPALPATNQGYVTITGGASIEKAGRIDVFSGGSLRASDADFINCGIISFNDYAGNSFSNLNKCDLIRDANFTQSPSPQVLFINIKNITLSGCTFDNSGSGSSASDAVVGFDAKFSIRKNCTFNGYATAVAGYDCGINPFATFSVTDNTFTDNHIGVSSFAVDNIVVKGNDFNGIGNNNMGPVSRGLELNNCSGFVVEGSNTFTGAGPGIPSIGINAHNTGSENHTISNNSFQDLNVANQAELSNNNSVIPLNGLQYSCISNLSAINFDFFVTDGGIAQNQGNGIATSNTFSHFNTGQPGDFNNISAIEIKYYHDNSSAGTPQPNMFFRIEPIPADASTDCSSGGNDGGVNTNGGGTTGEPGNDDTELTPAEEQVLVTEYNTVKSEYNGQVAAYGSLPEGSAAAEAMELDMAKSKGRMQQVAGRIIRSILADTTGLDLPKLRTWLANKESREADYKIVESYLYEADFANAVLLRDSVPIKYPLSGKEATEHGYYAEWTDFKIGILGTAGQAGLLALDSAGLSQVINIADKSEGIAGTQAQSLLNAVYGYNFALDPKMPTASQALVAPPSGNLLVPQASQNHRVAAFPNPAKERVNFSYQLEEDAGYSYISLTDINGKEVAHLVLDSQQGQVKWDTAHLPGGVYLYRLVSENEKSETHKLVLTNW